MTSPTPNRAPLSRRRSVWQDPRLPRNERWADAIGTDEAGLGPTQRRVAMAYAAEAGTDDTFHAGRNRIRERTGMRHTTVGRARKRLIQLGWITILPLGDPQRPSYQLTIPERMQAAA